MHSLRTKITLVTLALLAIAVSVVAALSVFFVRNDKQLETNQLLLLLCETGEQNLDYYFDRVQKAVGEVARFTEEDLEKTGQDDLMAHTERVEKYFMDMAGRTDGVLTYYYRIDPEVSDSVKGFWYTNLEGEGFEPHEVTDITLYDTEDTSSLVWFTVPRHTRAPIWQAPYITDNLDVRVISYNVPIIYRGRFIGVVGIEIDYSVMAEQVESIRLYDHGYAFLCDAAGNIFYHPRIDVTQLNDKNRPPLPEGLIGSKTFVRYTYDGVEKEAAWLPLSNGMRLNVCVPVAETNGDWMGLVREILITSAAVLLALCLFTLFYTRRITDPLERLTRAAEQVDNGNYDVKLDYDADDEVGRLTKTFRNLSDHMREHISDLNKRVYVDALTSVKNKGAFSSALDALDDELKDKGSRKPFAIGVFDCNNLKTINDRYGHDKGDIYLKTACRLICHVFQHSPVYRIGGDEFAVILKHDDFENREALISTFRDMSGEINAATKKAWEKVDMAVGAADYDSEIDASAIDVVRRADSSMYANKREQKNARLAKEES